MAFNQTDVDTLKAAIATGAMRVRYADGREITYRSQAELERALTLVQGEVTGPDAKPSRSFLVEY
jgi:predicted lipid-binding transport protein (Tim44 family)